jgi:hypothetical protein
MDFLSARGVVVTCRWQPWIPGVSESPEEFVPRMAVTGCRHLAFEHLKLPLERSDKMRGQRSQPPARATFTRTIAARERFETGANWCCPPPRSSQSRFASAHLSTSTVCPSEQPITNSSTCPTERVVAAALIVSLASKTFSGTRSDSPCTSLSVAPSGTAPSLASGRHTDQSIVISTLDLVCPEEPRRKAAFPNTCAPGGMIPQPPAALPASSVSSPPMEGIPPAT